MMSYGVGWLGLLGILVVILFWILVIALAFFAVRALLRSTNTPNDRNYPPDHLTARPGGSSAALDILKERYARGEITRDEYQAMRRDLES